MIKGIVSRGALYWLRAPKNIQDLYTDEWILAIIRLLLGMCYLGSILQYDSAFKHRIYEISSLAFLAYGIVIISFLHFRRVQPPFFHLYIHCADIIWATQLICLIHWPLMAFALLFFIMVSTAYRWGFWEAYLTFAIFCIFLLTGQYLFNPSLALSWHSAGNIDLFLEPPLCIGIVCMIGILAEAKASRSESLSIARIIAGVPIAAGPEQAMRVANMEGLRIFGATQLLVVMQETSGNRTQLFRIVHPQNELFTCEIDLPQRENYLFPAPGTSICLRIAHPSGKNQFRCLMLKSGKIQKNNTCCDLPGAFLSAHPFRRLLAIAFAIEKELTVRVFVIDPRPFFSGAAGLRFLERCVSQISPIIQDKLAVGRLTKKARAAAGSQVARELHDGIIQSLLLINKQLHDLRRQVDAISAPIVEPLERLQNSLQLEIVALRDFTQQQRALELDSRSLLSFFAGMAVKFQVEHGIAARFVTDLKEVSLAPQICVELARFAQEALTNVRKHSSASEALVRLNRRNGDFVLSIIDNGHGFGFSGHRSYEALLASGEGPQILMERANTINGKVSIESIHDSGSCVEIAFPYE